MSSFRGFILKKTKPLGACIGGCPICLQHYSQRKPPMRICTHCDDHMVCTDCVGGLEKFDKCPLCRHELREFEAREVMGEALLSKARIIANNTVTGVRVTQRMLSPTAHATESFPKCSKCCKNIYAMEEAFTCLKCTKWYERFWASNEELTVEILKEAFCYDCHLRHTNSIHSSSPPSKVKWFMRSLSEVLCLDIFGTEGSYASLDKLVTQSLKDSRQYDLIIFAQIFIQAMTNIPTREQNTDRIKKTLMLLPTETKRFQLLFDYVDGGIERLSQFQRYEVSIWSRLMVQAIRRFTVDSQVEESYCSMLARNHHQLLYLLKSQDCQPLQEQRQLIAKLSLGELTPHNAFALLNANVDFFRPFERNLIVEQCLRMMTNEAEGIYAKELLAKLWRFTSSLLIVEKAEVILKNNM
ncbi:unnamed protein product, partial [Mesorhabditis belari]|uniref:RING-type domain-containing protein n=1 Tax=Mesorhabditis belari TaxID=2138241 RepID=A0AAF3F4G6_9BILA